LNGWFVREPPPCFYSQATSVQGGISLEYQHAPPLHGSRTPPHKEVDEWRQLGGRHTLGSAAPWLAPIATAFTWGLLTGPGARTHGAFSLVLSGTCPLLFLSPFAWAELCWYYTLGPFWCIFMLVTCKQIFHQNLWKWLVESPIFSFVDCFWWILYKCWRYKIWVKNRQHTLSLEPLW
jgi:hypothetical protein